MEWARIGGHDAVLLDGDAELAAVLRDATERAAADPTRPIAVIARAETIESWQANAPDRLKALVCEGMLAIAERSAAASPGVHIDARSAAEAVLFEALEATAATANRFELNGRLAVTFGNDAAEVDLLSRRDRIAIEIDGYHHFTDAERYRRDRRKDLLLQIQGLLVIRLLAGDVMREPLVAVRTICQALASRGEYEPAW